jgi:uncharacterized membrane protein YfcA
MTTSAVGNPSALVAASLPGDFGFSLPGAVLIVLGYALITDRWGAASWWIDHSLRADERSLDPRKSGPHTRRGAAILGTIAILMGCGYLYIALYGN